MKSLFFFIACLIFSQSVFAQNHEWAPIGAKWWWSLSDQDIEGEAYYLWEVIEEDSFEGEFVKVIDVTLFGYDSMVVANFDTIHTFSRNDSVFLFDKFASDYKLIFDFGVEVGDTIVYPVFEEDLFLGVPDFKTVVKNIYLFEEGSRRSFQRGDIRYFDLEVLDQDTFWIENSYYEGFGSTNTLLIPRFNLLYGPRLRCYYDENIEFHDYYVEHSTGIIELLPCDYYRYSSTKDPIWNHPDFKVYPNPVQTDLNIELPDFVKEGEWYLVDLAGKKVIQGVLSGNQLQINLASIPRGQYVFGAETANAVYYQKIFKE
ncbi:MAG: T9SS type A sorting domain-containing protein [Saprospiraceae bacterium]